jgi:hypothetical protein
MRRGETARSNFQTTTASKAAVSLGHEPVKLGALLFAARDPNVHIFACHRVRLSSLVSFAEKSLCRADARNDLLSGVCANELGVLAGESPFNGLEAERDLSPAMSYASEGGALVSRGRGAIARLFEQALGPVRSPRPEPWEPLVFASHAQAAAAGLCMLKWAER